MPETAETSEMPETAEMPEMSGMSETPKTPGAAGTPPPPRARLRLDAGLLRDAAAFLLAVAVLLAGAELTARAFLGAPSAEELTLNRALAQQVATFEAYREAGGAVDCVVVGSSMAARGLDPEVISAAYARRTGQEIGCFNFAIPGADMAAVERILEALLVEADPAVVLVGTAPIAEIGEREHLNRILARDPWITTRTGGGGVLGWALRHSAGFQLGFRLLRSDEGPRSSVNRFGFRVREPRATRHLLDYQRTRLGTIAEMPPRRRQRGMKQNAAALRRIAGLDATVVVVDMPWSDLGALEPAEIAAIDSVNAAGWSLLDAALPDAVAESGQPPLGGGGGARPVRSGDATRPARPGAARLTPPDTLSLPPAVFADHFHLDDDGAARLSRWVGHALARTLDRAE
jgi:hypothetical protein